MMFSLLTVNRAFPFCSNPADELNQNTTMADSLCSFAEDYWSSLQSQTPPPTPPQEGEQMRARNPSRRKSKTTETAADPAVVEQTIHGMEDAGCCAHPAHWHSFRPLPLLGGGGGTVLGMVVLLTKRECGACGKSTSPLGGDPAVRCAACGVLAHRSCASDRRHWHRWRQRECAVNAAHLQRQQQQQQDNNGTNGETKGDKEEEETICFGDPAEQRKLVWKKDESENDDNQQSSQTINNSANEEETTSPPQPSLLPHDKPPKIEKDKDDNEGQSENRNSKQRNNSKKKKPPLPLFANSKNGAQSFASVARALQENVLKSFNHPAKKADQTTRRRRTAPFPGARARRAKAKQQQKHQTAVHQPTTTTTTTDDVKKNIASALSTEEREESTPPPPILSPSASSNDIWDAVRSKVNVGIVAGAIAGGAAGLALAGPAGAYVGYMAAGSALAEGAMGAASVGVVAAGLATGTVAGHQINERMEERVLTMGEEGASQKVLLVRPSIQLDPVWNQIMQEARRSAPPRNRRTIRSVHSDSDITMTEEDEIGTSDKVLLLVSRMLNDKTSLSGHVYRYLIETFRDRARKRETLCARNDSIVAVSPRARRDDAHAVIKHVTACLLEERPELGSSSGLTEVAANAVEGLVFGQLYHSVYEEIALETMELDAGLWRKITVFEAEYGSAKESMAGLISEPALAALTMLPEAHSAADKLHFGVKFLDQVSKHFANMTDRSVCADSLLKMVCQHMVFAENQGGLNSQICFLEEFARDQQLLRGREGYALVTMQASLHFLNMATDLYQEIFADDGDLLLEDDDNNNEEEEDATSLSADISSTVSISSNEGDHHREEADDDGSTASSCDNDEESSFASCKSG